MGSISGELLKIINEIDVEQDLRKDGWIPYIEGVDSFYDIVASVADQLGFPSRLYTRRTQGGLLEVFLLGVSLKEILKYRKKFPIKVKIGEGDYGFNIKSVTISTD